MRGVLRLPTLTPAADGSDTFEIVGWRVFGPGYWKGDYYSPARVKRVADNYATLKAANPDHAPRQKLGHDKRQRLAASLGLPNVGRVTDLRLRDDGWFEIDVRGIPRTVMATDQDGNAVVYDLEQAVADGQYDSGSVEIAPRVRHPDKATEWLEDVFDGIALLGEENPALRTVGRPRPTFSDSRTPTLCFSEADYSETPPVDQALLQALATKLGIDVNDPQLATLTPEQVQAFSGGMAAAPGGFDPSAFSDSMAKRFSEMLGPIGKRLEAAEAAVSDTVKKSKETGIEAMMSEAVRRLDAATATGRLFPVVKDQTLKQLREAAATPTVFSDGPNKGKTAFSAILDEIEARQPDAMFSEHAHDTATEEEASTFNAWERKVLRNSPSGRAVLRSLSATKN